MDDYLTTLPDRLRAGENACDMVFCVQKGTPPLTSTFCGHHPDCDADATVDAVTLEVSQLILPVSKLLFLSKETSVLRSSND